MKFTLNRRVFADNILLPASKLSDNICLELLDKELKTLVTSNDNSVMLLARLTCSHTSKNTKVIIPDTKTFLRLFSGVTDEEVTLIFDDNVVTFVSPTFSFKYHLLDESYINNKRAISEEKIRSISYDTNFYISRAKLSDIIKYNSIIPDAEKLYFYTKDGKVYSKIGDEQKANTNEINIEVSSEFDGQSLEEKIPLNIQSILLTSFTEDKIKIAINHSLKLFKISTAHTQYIISGLVK